MKMANQTRGPFAASPLMPRSLWDKLLFRENPGNAYVELVNALARTDDIRSIPEDFADTLNRKYRTNLHSRRRADLDRIYADFLRHCLADLAFTAREAEEANRLRRLFLITDAKHAKIFSSVADETHRRAVKRVIADGKVTDNERRALEYLAASLLISERTSKAIYKDEVDKMLQGRLDAAVSDCMLSPQEEAELQELAAGLGVELTHSAATARTLDSYRAMWRVRYGDLPTLDSGINLRRGEVCYMKRAVEWHEMRRQRVGATYSGPTMRLKIAKGVYWRTGTLGIKPVTRDTLVKIDSGHAYITNKRLLFTGAMKNTSIPLNRILDITKYSDGVGIEKDAGKSPVLVFHEGIDIFCAVLSRVISEQAP
ncbi:MAG TPA: hypothetical protein P5125_01060 [Kiritimatiellia bacterium]|nr:hypothetical protein [Kiritimatiellia bacterium]HOR98654.1 hypothetical protein [Kiritimatiellia bacterium]HRU18921.1 hypothetical protein [Kiritimatiellia bacterium]